MYEFKTILIYKMSSGTGRARRETLTQKNQNFIQGQIDSCLLHPKDILTIHSLKRNVCAMPSRYQIL